MTSIDLATPSDLTRILRWLKHEGSGFFDNRNMLRHALDVHRHRLPERRRCPRILGQWDKSRWDPAVRKDG